MKFRTQYSSMKTVFSNPGKRMKVVYELKVNERGKRGIEKVGETDLQQAIDSEFPSVDLNMVLKRLENGDTDALEKVKGFYADVAALPVDMRSIMEMNEQASKIFNEMPDSYRKLYENDYLQFLYDPGKLVDVIEQERKLAESEVIVDDDEKQQ